MGDAQTRHLGKMLIKACLAGDAAAVSRLLPAGGTELDLSGPDFQEPTCKSSALIVAATFGHTDIVRIMLERARNTAVDYVDAQPVPATAMMTACQFHHVGIIRLLAARGANVNVNLNFTCQLGQRRQTLLSIALLPMCSNGVPISLAESLRDPDPGAELATVRELLQLGAGTLPAPATLFGTVLH